MARRVEIVPARREHVEEMAPWVREVDAREIKAATGLEPLEALLAALEVPGDANAVFLDGEIVTIFGMSPQEDGSGVLWMIGTDGIYDNADLFHEHTSAWLEYYRERYTRIFNFVDARNVASLKWAASVGFIIHPAEPRGHDGTMFHRIEWTREI